MYGAAFSTPFTAADVHAVSKASAQQTSPAIPMLCEEGRPYFTDPISGRRFCACQLSRDSPHPHLPGGAGSLPGALKTLAAPPGSAVPPGMDAAAYYGPLVRGFPVRPERLAQCQTAGFDPMLAAAHPYNLLFAGFDVNGLGMRKAATRETTGPLKAWLHEHRKNPYPTKAEKIMLAIITKMTLTQVSTWFANARRRLKKENRLYSNSRDNDDDPPDKDDDEDNDTENGTMRDAGESDEDINVDVSDASDDEDSGHTPSTATSTPSTTITTSSSTSTPTSTSTNTTATSTPPPPDKQSPTVSSLPHFPAATPPFARPAFSRGLPSHLSAVFPSVGVLPFPGPTNGINYALNPAVNFGLNPGVSLVNPGLGVGLSPGGPVGTTGPPGLSSTLRGDPNLHSRPPMSSTLRTDTNHLSRPALSPTLRGDPILHSSPTLRADPNQHARPAFSVSSSAVSPSAEQNSRPKIWSISEIIHSERSEADASAPAGDSPPASSRDTLRVTPRDITVGLTVRDTSSSTIERDRHRDRDGNSSPQRAHRLHDHPPRGLPVSLAPPEVGIRHPHPFLLPVRHPAWMTPSGGLRHQVTPYMTDRLDVQDSARTERSSSSPEVTSSCDVKQGEGGPQTEALDLQTKKEDKENKGKT